jgi:hypothetical protein
LEITPPPPRGKETLGRGMSDQSLEPPGSDYGLVGPNALRTTPLHSVALRVMITSIKILLLEPIIPIDNPHRGSGERLCEKSVIFFETFTPEEGLIQA